MDRRSQGIVPVVLGAMLLAACGSDSSGEESKPGATGGAGGAVCESGRVVTCPCLSGSGEGTQRCNDDGSGWGPCECPDGGVAGQSGSAGSGGTSGSGGAGSGGAAQGGSGGSAGGGEAGGGGVAGSSGVAGAAGSTWTDEECGDYGGNCILSQGDENCDYYNPAGWCAGTVSSADEIETLTEDSFAACDTILVRTPSHPGSNPPCSGSCSGPGTVASIRIPIDIFKASNDYSVIKVRPYHIPYGSVNPAGPWRVVYSYELATPPVCLGPTSADCTEVMDTQIVLYIETDDPNAPSRLFAITHPDHGGTCQ